nr:MAG: polyprotein 1 [Picornavirales sp.]
MATITAITVFRQALTAFEFAAARAHGYHTAAFLVERLKGTNVNLDLFKVDWSFLRPTIKLASKRFKTSDVDVMSMEEFEEALGVEYEEQISLGDFMPPEFKPTLHSVKDTRVLDHFFTQLPQDSAVQLEAVEQTQNMMDVFHSLNNKDHRAFLSFFNTVAPHLQPTYLETIMKHFRLGEVDIKHFKNKRNFNSKALARLSHNLDMQLANRSQEACEFQIFEFFNNIGNVARNVSNITDNLNKTSETVGNVVLDVSNQLGSSATSAINSMLDLVKRAEPLADGVRELRTLIQQICQNAKDHSIALTAQVFNLFIEKDYSKWLLSLTTITSMLGLNKMMIDKLIDMFTKGSMFQASSTIKLLALASTFLGKYNPVNLIGMGSAFTAMREVKALEELSELVQNVAIEWGLMSSPEAEVLAVVKESVSVLLSDLIELELMEMNNPSKFLVNKNAEKVKVNYDKSIELERQFIYGKAKGTEKTILVAEITKLVMQYKALNSRVQNIRRGESTRQEPVALAMLGPPGIGKSKVTARLVLGDTGVLATRFKLRMLDCKSQWDDLCVPEWNVWNENVQNLDYADGYCGQEIHTTDDMFQAASDDDHQRYINYISPQRFLTNQAALESKGMPYTSKLLIGSCNKFPSSSKKIKDIGALHRRFIVVDCVKVAAVPSDFDPEFKHLRFDIYKTGADYINKQLFQQMTLNELADFILDQIQLKYKMYCQETNQEYEFQVNTSDVKRVSSKVEMMRLCMFAERYEYEDWLAKTNHYNPDPEKAFLRIMYANVQGSGKLIELCRTDPSYSNVERVMKDYKLWLSKSHSAVERFARHGKYFSYLDGNRLFVIYFKMENGVPTTYVYDESYSMRQNDADFDRELIALDQFEDAESTFGKWSKYCWEKFFDMFCPKDRFTPFGANAVKHSLGRIYTMFSPIFGGIWSQMKRGASTFLAWTQMPATAVEIFVARILDFCGFSGCMSAILGIVLEMALTHVAYSVIAYVIVCLYQKIVGHFVRSKSCEDCEYNNNILDEYLQEMRTELCERKCKIGYVFSTHCEACKNFSDVIPEIRALFCGCEGECDDECGHSISEPSRVYEVFRTTFIILYQIPPTKFDQRFQYEQELSDVEVICRACDYDTTRLCKRHQFCEEFASVIKERPATGRRMKYESGSPLKGKAKSRVNFESGSPLKGKGKKAHNFESGSPLKGKGKKAHNFESGSSLKGKGKKAHNFEDSDNSRIRMNEEDLELEFEVQTDPGAIGLAGPLTKISVQACREKHGLVGALHGLGYKNFVFTPNHLFENNSYKYYFIREMTVSSGEVQQVQVEMEFIHGNRDRDIAIWRFEGNPFSEVLERHVASNAEIERYLPNASNCVMIIPMFDTQISGKCLVQLVNCHGTHMTCHKIPIRGGEKREFTEILKVVGITHPCIQTRSGDCGSPIVMCHPKAQRKVIGFHILGCTKNSYSAVFSQETMHELLDKADQPEVDMEIDEVFVSAREELETSCSYPVLDIMKLCNFESEHPFYTPEGDIEYVGEYNFNSVPAKDTALVKHALYGAFPVTQIPAVLQNSEVEDPSKLDLNGRGQPDILLTQMNKYSTVFDKVDGLEQDLADMENQLVPHFISVLGKENLGLMTEQEVLSGVIERIGSNPLDVRTTAGEPFARLGKTQGKKKNSFLHLTVDGKTNRKLWTIDDSTTHGKYLKDVIKEKELCATKGIRTLSLWKNCLKDETRPIEKVKVGKTRLFTAAPFDTVFLGRKYFGNFKEAWQSHREELFHSVGINPMSTEWSDLVTYLKSRGQDFGDADYSSYDGNLRADFMNTAGNIVIKTICKVTKADFTPYQVIWNEFVETFHVSGRNIHLIKHGNPSGNPLTTVVNCIVNFMYHWWCYRKITGKTSLSSFNKDVGFTCFGDDVLYSTNEDITGYTFNEIAKWMKVLQQDYTTALKTTGDVPRKTLSEVQFLKRKFVKYSNLKYLAPLDTESIEQQFNYTNIGESDIEAMATQIEEACIEAALHPKEYYDRFRKILDGAIRQNYLLHKHVCCVSTYADVRAVALKRSLEQVA